MAWSRRRSLPLGVSQLPAVSSKRLWRGAGDCTFTEHLVTPSALVESTVKGSVVLTETVLKLAERSGVAGKMAIVWGVSGRERKALGASESIAVDRSVAMHIAMDASFVEFGRGGFLDGSSNLVKSIVFENAEEVLGNQESSTENGGGILLVLLEEFEGCGNGARCSVKEN